MSKKTIKELVEEAGVKLVPIGENIYRGSCPFHINVNTPSFTVYAATDSWFCFGESIGGDIYSFYSRLKGCSYRVSKEALDGSSNVLEEIVQTLDGIGVVDEKDYRDELNFAVSKYCRDLMYRRPELVNKVMEFLKKMDKDLTTKKISAILMAELIVESRKLEIN
jgi:DNA primase